jgi:hypothetical protein
MEHSFEDKVAIVGSAFYSRFDEEGEPEILQKIFDSQDLAGAIALAVLGGDVEIKSDDARGWIEESYKVLNAIFDFPVELEKIEVEKPVAKKKAAPKKKAEVSVE